MTSDYVALLDYLKIGKVTLVGWSDGGIIGIDMAMKHPEKLTRVVAQAANVTTDGVKSDVMSNKTFADYINVAGEYYQKLSPTPKEYDAFVKQISEMWATQPTWTAADLGKITVPVTLAIGDHGVAFWFGRPADVSEIVSKFGKSPVRVEGRFIASPGMENGRPEKPLSIRGKP